MSFTNWVSGSLRLSSGSRGLAAKRASNRRARPALQAHKPRLESLEERLTPTAGFSEFLDPHPAPGNHFGSLVLPLSTGNVVITSPNDDAGGTDAGAVYLLNGATGALISTLTGSHAFEYVGNQVVALSNGNFVVSDPLWANGEAANAGAATFGSGVSGVSGVVSAANSLVGSSANDFVSSNGVKELSNGNFVLLSPSWSNGATAHVGAVTFGSGTSGVSGVVSAANSLVGSSANDAVGYGAIALSSGNYLVNSPYWSGGAGALTFGSGTSGVSGVVSAANSLVGSAPNQPLSGGFWLLSNGNYLVSSSGWSNGAGAVTFGSGVSGVSGVVSAANSLVGSSPGDQIGAHVTLLSNGNYVVSSPYWSNGAAANAGAVTFGSGTSGVRGVVSADNSLVGSAASDYVSGGFSGVTALSNGNYVVDSASWSDGAGAVTFGSGTSGVSGVVSAANSLVGSQANMNVGYSVTTLTNGNYVVSSPYWSNGAGAATFGIGTTGISGEVSAANSLVGSSPTDTVGIDVTALSNGNYVVESPGWSNGTATFAGAATFGNGTSGVSGVISAANSLVGSSANDGVGSRVFALSNGNYVVQSPGWSNGTATAAGAVTFGSGSTGVSGVVGAANSLVGSSANDRVGAYQLFELKNGNYVVCDPNWTNGAAINAGEVTFGSGTSDVSGVVSAANSLVGSSPNDMEGRVVPKFLPNGSYLVTNEFWSNNAGAVTFGSGTSGVSGVVSAANSLVGSSPGDFVGSFGAPSLTVLSNGNYVVSSPYWSNFAGAVTFGSGTSGVSGVVSAANSLIGVGPDHSVTPLSNGNYLVDNPDWSNRSGAVTFGSGTSGVSGVISAANSLVGLVFGTNLQTIPVLDNVNANYYGVFLNEGGGRVRVASQVDGLSGPATTHTSVTSSGTTTVFGQNVTFTVSVGVFATESSTPTGTVTFRDGSNILGTSTLDSSDQATFAASGLSVGTHVITVTYDGDANFRASLSPVLSQTVISAQQEVALTVNQVNTLVTSGALNAGNGGALNTKLDSANTSLNGGDTTAGINQLNAFINQVTAFQMTGKLTSAQAQSLINAANLAIAAATGGSGAHLMTPDASGASGSTDTQPVADAGQLVSGTLGVYLDNADGTPVAADEQTRFDGALNVLDATFGPYGVNLVDVGVANAASAIVQVEIAATSAAGSAADGVLGCTLAGKITLVTGWNWYTGADPNAIGSGQYDFQTIVTHELGHAIGMGHSGDTGSVMFPYLATAEAHREITTLDMSVLEVTSGSPEPLLAAQSSDQSFTPAAREVTVSLTREPWTLLLFSEKGGPTTWLPAAVARLTPPSGLAANAPSTTAIPYGRPQTSQETPIRNEMENPAIKGLSMRHRDQIFVDLATEAGNGLGMEDSLVSLARWH
jgi:hypothetical protein